jgi:hypothetical protein
MARLLVFFKKKNLSIPSQLWHVKLLKQDQPVFRRLGRIYISPLSTLSRSKADHSTEHSKSSPFHSSASTASKSAREENKGCHRDWEKVVHHMAEADSGYLSRGGPGQRNMTREAIKSGI